MKIENKYYISNKGFLIGIRAIYDAINQEAFDGQLPKIPIKLYPIDNNTTNYQTAAAFCVEKKPFLLKLITTAIVTELNFCLFYLIKI